MRHTFLRVSVGARVTPRAKLLLASPIVSVINQLDLSIYLPWQPILWKGPSFRFAKNTCGSAYGSSVQVYTCKSYRKCDKPTWSIYLSIYHGSQYFEDGYHLDSQRLPVGACVTLRAKYTPASPIARVTKELAVFSIDIAPMHSHTTSQNCCRATYFATEMTQITGRLLYRDLCKTSLWWFALMRSQSSCGRTDPSSDVTDPSSDVTSILNLLSVRDLDRVLGLMEGSNPCASNSLQPS